jgi:hypothetical protein
VQALLDSGTVHLPTLYEFRDATRYKGQILDVNEGRVQLECRYSFFSGLAKEANGTLPLNFAPYEHVTFHGASISEEIDSGNLLIYCMTRFMLSDSLIWAIGEKKESCALITDVEAAQNHISSAMTAESLTFYGIDDCIYAGRHVVDLDPSRTSVANYLLVDRRRAAFIKPQEYASQREVRAIWLSAGDVLGPVTRSVPAIRELCIPVRFSGINVDTVKRPRHGDSIGGRMYRKSASNPAEFDMQQPWDVCSPVIHAIDGEEAMLGFYYAGASNTFAHMTFSNCSIGVLDSHIGRIFCSVPLSDVESIEFFHR